MNAKRWYLLLSLVRHSKPTHLKESDRIWAEYSPVFDVNSPWKMAVCRDVFLTFISFYFLFFCFRLTGVGFK